MLDPILNTNDFESILVDKALGSWIWDTDGKKYLDCTSGVWCLHIGHNHPKLISAIKSQIDNLIHTNNRFLSPITLESAKKVLDFIPGHYDKITFLNSGSEAVEFSISLAKKITGQEDVLSLKDTYCGSYGTSKLISYTSGKESKLKLPYNKCTTEVCNCIDSLIPTLEELLDGESTQPACFVLEPIMVSGGIHKPCTKYVKEVCKVIREAGGLIIANEVTTGLGRSGKRFGFMHHEINPDIIVLGKGLGAGYPVSAIVTKSELASKVPADQKYYVQSHQLDPLGSAIAKTVVEIITEEEIVERSQEIISILEEFFSNLEHPSIKEIRQYGMIIGIQIQPCNNKTSTQLILEIKNKLLEEGIMIGLSLGKDLLRLLPPLNMTMEEVKFLKQKMNKTFENLNK
ncbi:MAG: class-III pyridoxal-phosphate-dependent aminotransferase [Candidatus Heimdallarchaeaceae archaeon]